MSAEPSFPTASGDTLESPAPQPARGGPAGESYAFPPSFAQERMWFLEQLRPGSPLYHVRARLRLAGGLDVPALRRALAELLRRHEALRTVFREVEGSPLQVVHPPVPMELPLADLRALPAPAAETEAARLAAEGASRLFDLERGPVLRTWLVRSGGAEHHLLLTVHHIAFDGWSAGVFFRELADLYGAFARGLPSPLPEPEVQYADYALWQREWLSGEVLDRELEFWRERLRGAPPLLELPLDRSRPAVQGHRGATRRFLLPAELAAALRRLAREEGATLFMALLGGVSALLSRYSGQTDMLLGTPVAGRMSPELEGVVGLFVNTLVLRGDLSGDPSFRGLLRRVRDTTLDAYAHQELPFERLVEALGVERSLGHHPLFQVMLALQNAAWEPVAPAGLAMELVEVPGTTSKFDLSLLAHEQAQGALSVAVEYAGDLFEDATVEALARHLRVLLESAAARPEARLSGLSLLDAREERQVLAEWNRTARPYPRELCVHHLFELQAGRTPDAVAVVSGGDALSYAELDRAADRMADRLRPLGVGPDARVGLCAERGADLLVGLLGILKAGAACVPLDPAYPAERLAFMLEDSAMPVLVAHEHLAERLPTSGVSVVHLGAGPLSAAVPPSGSPAPAPGPENLAYVIYTSGSTGRPKGVAMPHRPLVNLLAWQERDWRAPGPATTLQFATISFDASFHEIFSCWAAGGTLVLAPEDARRDPDAVLSLVEEGGVERLFLPFVALQQVAERAVALGLAPARLREVQTAGEQLRVTGPIRRWLGALGAPLYNHYGPSETHVVTSRVLEGGTDAWPLLPPIGRPVANTSCYVLDATQRPVPAGVPGELFVGGESLARGYLGQPGLTAERFLPDPFGAAGARMYRTGDRVRWLAAGELEFLGRTDRQVKLRGFRVEPEEVAAALERHPGVREAVAAVRADPAGDPRLVAYVVPAAPGVPPAPAELREHAARVLPDYMVPSAFVVLEHLPLTASGKTDHRALPAPDYASAGEYLAPRTAAEEVLAGIWSHVLRLDRVGVLDNFFALGGHSLLATRVVSRVREAFRAELPLRALFEAPTVAALAERVEAGLGWRGGAEPPPLRPAPRDPLIPLPLSFAQQRLWLLEQMDPGGAAYLVPTALRLRGTLDVQLLRMSLADLAARHESLRTRFPAVDGSPVQLVEGAAPVPLPVADLERVADGDREALLARIAADEARRPFDLAAGPVFRAALARLGGEEWVLFLTLHHIVCDGWSMGVLLRDLAALHGARVRGGAADLPALPVQYADYAGWQRGWLRGEVLDRQLAFWRTRLAGAPPLLELPTDRPRLPGGRAPGAGCRRVLPAGPTAGLRTLARREGATLFMALLAAWQVLLARYSGQDDVVSGIPVANRPRTELEGVVGFFVNTLPVRTAFHGAATFTDVLAGVREATLGALAYQDLPFERLVEELEIGRSPGHAPLVQVMFVLSDAEEAGLRLGDARVEPMEATGAAAKFDLTLSAAPVDGELRLALGYRADLWEEATIAAMLEHFARLLEGAASGPAAPAFELPLLSAGERGRVLGWSRGPGGPPPRRCVHELFEAQADRTPGAVAVVFGEEAATYAELEARANRLARHLRGLGVGPETRVGVCLERSTEMVVALLGVLKAGGAYVPLDPSYPAERLAFMLEDAAAPVLLTESGVAAGLPAVGGRVVCLDAEAERIAAHGPERAGVEVGPENLAYVIYTSGSTGRPKGTEVPHRAIPGFFWEVEYARFGAGQVVLQHSSTSWDVLTLELWPALLTGGRCVLHPERTPDLPVLHDSIRRHGVNTLWLPAALFNLVVDTRPEALEGIRQLMTGGEAVSAAHARRALELYPGLRLVNGYGPSECTVFTNCHVVPRGSGGATVPIGAPVGDRRVYVLDRLLSPVPAGVPGELYVGGPSVARGYLGRAALTAERFVPDAFAGEPGARLYRTGDRVRWLGDGTVEFLGRADDQVKVRGFRVEPGEVEAALLAHPGVREAAVVLRAGSAGEKVLAAYAVPAPGARIAAEELRAQLRERLPEFMVPSVVVTLEALPLTPNGKLDRRALPDPPAALPDAGSSPRDAVEELLAALWAEVLGAGPVGIHDDFFELGGHSLRAVQLAARVRATFRRELPLRALFEAPTVARLAARLREGLPAERRAAPPLVPAARDPRRGLPLSFAQERLWFLEQMRPGTPLYNVPMGLWMRGTLDVSALRRALDELARRHESLRTVFRAPHGSPVQEVLPAAPVEICSLDLTRVAAGAREGAALRAAADGAERPFDLAAGPPLRASLLRVAPDEHLLVLVVHHVVSDLWSVGILFRELSALYGAGVRGEPSPLPEPTLQYADFAVWQREWLRGEALERQTAYWRGRLAGAPPLELPTDRPRPAVQGSGGAVHRFHVAAPLAAELRALAGREGATLFMVLLAAFDVLLSRYADQEDVLVGSPVSGRSHEELEGVVGFLTNTLVLRARLPRGLGFGGLLGQVRETMLDGYAHQDLPFEKLVEELGTDRSLDRSPLFQVLFTLQNAPGGPLSLAGLELEPVGLASGTSKFDLTFLAREAEGAVGVVVEYATALFDPATVGRMAEHFGVLLEGAAADPARPVHALPLMRPAEERRVVSEWNATGAAYPAELCVHHLVLERVRRTPEAVAVASRGERVTYAELDRRSGRLARYLGRLGVSADSRVGLCLERSPELVTAVLAVLKAGGAYVPLDPAYPAERLDAMVRDAGMRVLLTTSGLAESLPRTGARLVLLDTEREAIGRESPDGPAAPVHPDNLAYVIYTSGSTGRPKGVAMTHRPLVNLLAWQERDWRTGGPAATLQFATVSFDASFHEIFSCWASGGTLVLASEEERRDPAAVLALLEGEGVERFFLPYVALQGVADAADALRPAPRRLREVQTAGEQLRVTEPIRRWMGALRAPLHNHYGPSETHVVTSHTLEGDPASWPLLPPIGRPIANTRCYVLDGRLGPAPVGVPGELYVGGVSLARGYLELPGLTAERFLPDPFAADGTRMYRTGDRVRWLAGGELDFLGRADHQVKIRGFRVECGEVEAALERHPAVREALVAAREDRPGDRRLVAYVVGAGAVPTAAELRAHARGVLPEHMVPSAFVVLERLPLASSGKIDRRHLPAPDPAPAEAYVPPGNDAERTVAEVWAEVLGITRVGVGANFFDLGGNSLLAVRVCHRLREALGREVPVVELFRHPTVRAFARALLPGGGRVRLDRVRARAGRAREALDRHGPADKRKGPAR